MLKSQEWQCFHADQWINLSWRFVETSMDKPLIMGFDGCNLAGLEALVSVPSSSRPGPEAG